MSPIGQARGRARHRARNHSAVHSPIPRSATSRTFTSSSGSARSSSKSSSERASATTYSAFRRENPSATSSSSRADAIRSPRRKGPRMLGALAETLDHPAADGERREHRDLLGRDRADERFERIRRERRPEAGQLARQPREHGIRLREVVEGGKVERRPEQGEHDGRVAVREWLDQHASRRGLDPQLAPLVPPDAGRPRATGSRGRRRRRGTAPWTPRSRMAAAVSAGARREPTGTLRLSLRVRGGRSETDHRSVLCGVAALRRRRICGYAGAADRVTREAGQVAHRDSQEAAGRDQLHRQVEQQVRHAQEHRQHDRRTPSTSRWRSSFASSAQRRTRCRARGRRWIRRITPRCSARSRRSATRTRATRSRFTARGSSSRPLRRCSARSSRS